MRPPCAPQLSVTVPLTYTTCWLLTAMSPSWTPDMILDAIKTSRLRHVYTFESSHMPQMPSVPRWTRKKTGVDSHSVPLLFATEQFADASTGDMHLLCGDLASPRCSLRQRPWSSPSLLLHLTCIPHDKARQSRYPDTLPP